MLFLLPIEPLEERYSAVWHAELKDNFARCCETSVYQIDGGSTSGRINNGQFLDVHETLLWKTGQLNTLLTLVKQGMLTDKDIVFFYDLWHPGIESLFYARDGLGLKFKIAGMIHAGTYDPWDWTSQCGMRRWGKSFENMLLSEADAVFVATQFHRDLICDSRHTRNNIIVTGFPRAWPEGLLEGGYNSTQSGNRGKVVVFPHRLAPEKHPEIFSFMADELKTQFPDWTFVRTKDIAQTKFDYYQILKSSRIAVSIAEQETWGIAMQEAALAGCLPLVPDRLSYSEMYEPLFTYGTAEELAVVLSRMMQSVDQRGGRFADYATALVKQQDRIQHSTRMAIPNMIEHMRKMRWNI